MHKNTIVIGKKIKNKKQIVKKISIIGIIINLIFAILKFIIGSFTNSQALLADSLHSLEDMASCIISIIGIKISTKKENKKHPYGYGKSEYIFSMIISMLMIMASLTMLKTTLNNVVLQGKINFNIWIVILCISNIIIKIILYLYTNKKLKEINNILIKANREDQRNDILITSSILISSIFSIYEVYLVDYLLGIIISIWIGFMGLKIFLNSYNILIDSNISDEKISEIKNKVLLFDEVESVDNIIGKPIGDKYVIILKISIRKDLRIYKYYDIQCKIKNILLNYEYIHDVIISVTPY